ncbi:hypothetical protein T265_07242 [Opisthorchis viverrini]|uniref:Uncharacterized protein n=1 Tax=Opisthorchis viverrini TaxID=6198 RepID=A0A074ZHP7_OPIVI|nr:hypothetical protein T265_07242 [Opisthorchis viverrini]KER25257.1 hypothetical protein T265_07242 [Opisthorchis viverrini]
MAVGHRKGVTAERFFAHGAEEFVCTHLTVRLADGKMLIPTLSVLSGGQIPLTERTEQTVSWKISKTPSAGSIQPRVRFSNLGGNLWLGSFQDIQPNKLDATGVITKGHSTTACNEGKLRQSAEKAFPGLGSESLEFKERIRNHQCVVVLRLPKTLEAVNQDQIFQELSTNATVHN